MTIFRHSIAVLTISAVNLVSADPCSLCPDGGNPTNLDNIIPQLGIAGKPNPTCEDAAAYAPYASSREVCRLLQSQAAFCGCHASSKPEATCNFCPGGEPPENGSSDTPFGNTCDELAEYVSFMTPEECETERGENLLRNGFLCGCPFTQPTCAICEDNSIDLDHSERIIPFFNLNAAQANPTCAQVAAAAAVAAPKTIDCDLVKSQGGFCGCKDTQPVNACSFCPGNQEPTRLSLKTPTGDTCESLYYYSQFLSEEECLSDRFHSIQALGFICGCPDTEPACTLCSDGSEPPSLEKETVPGGPTCGETANVIESYTGEVCLDQSTTIGVAAVRCGCEGAELPACNVQQNPHLCTQELLDSTSEECECYAFCDGEFAQCHNFPGGVLSAKSCDGVAVTGCNHASVYQEIKEAGKSGVCIPSIFSSLIFLAWTVACLV